MNTAAAAAGDLFHLAVLSSLLFFQCENAIKDERRHTFNIDLLYNWPVSGLHDSFHGTGMIHLV